MAIERLLVVDDDDSNRITLAALLDNEGYAVDESADCDDALRKLSTHRYSIVILDWRLGTRTGQELVAPIRSTQPNARIFVITGSTHGLDAASLGVDAVASKGGSFDSFLAQLRSL